MRALWIEMISVSVITGVPGSRPVRALWIEMISSVNPLYAFMSRPVRALWIEILEFKFIYLETGVEAREGLVD